MKKIALIFPTPASRIVFVTGGLIFPPIFLGVLWAGLRESGFARQNLLLWDGVDTKTGAWAGGAEPYGWKIGGWFLPDAALWLIGAALAVVLIVLWAAACRKLFRSPAPNRS